jgi:hypothetical protein
VSDESGAGSPGPRDKGFRDRKREDHALELIDKLRVGLDDIPGVRRILLELGRFYDPVLGGAVMEVSHQREIVEALEAGHPDRALAVIQRRYDLYIKDRVHLGGERGRSGPNREASGTD